MINYTVSWSAGNQPIGWSQPAPKLHDPLLRGLTAHRAKAWQDAQAAYLEAMRARPLRALAAYNFAVLLIDRGMGIASIPFLVRAAQLVPSSPDYQSGVVLAHLRSHDFGAGEALIAHCQDRGIVIDFPYWHHLFAQARAGLDPASLPIRPLVPLDPLDFQESADQPANLATSSPSHASLVNRYRELQALYRTRQLPTLLTALSPLLEQHPDWGEGHLLLGKALSAMRRWDAALEELRQAAHWLPGQPEVWDHLGNALDAIENFLEARRAYEYSLALNPLWHVSWNNAADAASGNGAFTYAFQYASLALTLAPDNDTCLLNFARAGLGLGNYNQARQALLLLLERNPKFASAERELGDLCIETGDHLEALHHLERALSLEPKNLGIHSSLLFLYNYLGTLTPTDLFQRAREYGRTLSGPLTSRHNWLNTPDPERKLRIGFVSGDLRQHPVGYFFHSVARALALSPALELYAFPTTRASDTLTDDFRTTFQHWVPIPGLNDDEAAACISHHEIDILVDLSGHTGRHRLGVFARKPAPLQITWLGYFGTTGLTQIDYLLAGPYDIQPQEEANYTEAIWRLPHTRLCFSRPEEEIAVGELPASGTGQVTFGCFNNLRKINDRVLGLWGQVLTALPSSRLFLKANKLDQQHGRQALSDRCQACGIDPSRLILEGPSSFAAYLAAYHRVDIALDPFPYTGGTTSIQALWMGVPVLTLAGDNLLARQGESLLRALEMEQWVASGEADYIERAVRLAGDLDALRGLRTGLRHRLEASPLMDAQRFAQDLEAAFRDMWRRWCAHHVHAER